MRLRQAAAGRRETSCSASPRRCCRWGTAGIVASSVPVDDEAVVPLMLALHEGLRRGLSMAEALRDARLAMPATPSTGRPAGPSPPSAEPDACDRARSGAFRRG
ncbi:CHAT domain-containing protein [Streptosporangium vulgare]|uniref:CHAT domain-containing protein n=1 Tax=Streptosporangium vulgare TaxID=46190 RepID=UPI003CD0B5F3